jgi:hypothetical protein
MEHLSVFGIEPVFSRYKGIRDVIFYILGFGIEVCLCSRIRYEKFYKFGISGAYLDIVYNVSMYVIGVLFMYYVKLVSNSF